MDKFDNPSQKNIERNKPKYHGTVVHGNRKVPPLEGENYQKIGGMWTLKHDISSQKLYELIIKTDIKGYTDIDTKCFYNHTNMCINV